MRPALERRNDELRQWLLRGLFGRTHGTHDHTTNPRREINAECHSESESENLAFAHLSAPSLRLSRTITTEARKPPAIPATNPATIGFMSITKTTMTEKIDRGEFTPNANSLDPHRLL